MSEHLEMLISRRKELAGCADDILSAVEIICESYRNGGKLLLCGNGGSAADCEHWAGELLKSFVLQRKLSQEDQVKLSPDLAENLQQGLSAIPLTGFISANSAFTNDVDSDYAYAQLVWSLGKPGDVLVGISTSGNASNVLYAGEAAKAKGIKTIGLSGQQGGQLASVAELCIQVSETETYKIQELHICVYHTICLMIEHQFFG